MKAVKAPGASFTVEHDPVHPLVFHVASTEPHTCRIATANTLALERALRLEQHAAISEEMCKWSSAGRGSWTRTCVRSSCHIVNEAPSSIPWQLLGVAGGRFLEPVESLGGRQMVG